MNFKKLAQKNVNDFINSSNQHIEELNTYHKSMTEAFEILKEKLGSVSSFLETLEDSGCTYSDFDQILDEKFDCRSLISFFYELEYRGPSDTNDLLEYIKLLK